MTITVVTPWFNHLELADDYWRAVEAAAARVLIIDNGSEPPLPNAVRVDQNLGFAAACNLGLRLATTDAVLFLNNDIRLRSPDWLSRITAALEPGVLVGADLRHGLHGDVDGQRLPYLEGWCLAGMRDDLLEIDGWDETFDEPAYYGDNDLCFRARLNGMTLRQVDVGLVHLGNTTAGPGHLPHIQTVSRANYDRYATRVREAIAEGVAA